MIRPEELTERDRYRLQLASYGYSLVEIAAAEGISEAAVSHRMWEVYSSLDANNITHAVAQALRYEIIR